MARNASGQYSLPSNYNPVVEDTPITVDWANQTLSDIATEITNSLDRSGRGAMTGQLQINAGTVSAPGLCFDGDANTGIYRVGADQMGLAAGGALQATASTSGLTIANALLASAGTQGAPGISFSADTNIGLYRAGADDLRVAINSVDVAKFTTKLTVAAATAATGATRQDALSLSNGDIDFSAVTQPDSTTALTNRLAATLVPKAWASFSMDGAATFAITTRDACNITSIVRGTASRIDVTIAGDMANANYAVIGTVSRAGSVLNPITLAAGTFSIVMSDSGGVVVLDALGVSVEFYFVIFGRQ